MIITANKSKTVKNTMAKISKSLSIIASKFTSGDYDDNIEARQKAMVSINNAIKTCASANKIALGSITDKATLIAAYKNNEENQFLDTTNTSIQEAFSSAMLIKCSMEGEYNEEMMQMKEEPTDEIEEISFSEEVETPEKAVTNPKLEFQGGDGMTDMNDLSTVVDPITAAGNVDMMDDNMMNMGEDLDNMNEDINMDNMGEDMGEDMSNMAMNTNASRNNNASALGDLWNFKG